MGQAKVNYTPKTKAQAEADIDRVIKEGTLREKGALYSEDYHQRNLYGKDYITQKQRRALYDSIKPEEKESFARLTKIAEKLAKSALRLTEIRNAYRRAALILRLDIVELEHAQADSKLLQYAEERIGEDRQLQSLSKGVIDTYKDIVKIKKNPDGTFPIYGIYKRELAMDSSFLRTQAKEYAEQVAAYYSILKDEDLKGLVSGYSLECLALFAEEAAFDTRYSEKELNGKKASFFKGARIIVGLLYEPIVHDAPPYPGRLMDIAVEIDDLVPNDGSFQAVSPETMRKIIALTEEVYAAIPKERKAEAKDALLQMRKDLAYIEENAERAYFPDNSLLLDESLRDGTAQRIIAEITQQ